MTTVEKLTPAWREAFLASRNSLFTPAHSRYWDAAENITSSFPMRTYIGRDETNVMSWGSFFVRGLELGRRAIPSLNVALAFAIGTLPDYQRQGLGAKVWRTAEESLAHEVDGVLVYTGESGKGYPFYRAMGYLPLLYPQALRLMVSQESCVGKDAVRTTPFSKSRDLSSQRGNLFATCYQGHGGFMAGRPGSLDRWADVSFFYDQNSVGCAPQISWLEDATTKRWLAYAIWAGPIEKVEWKKGAVEIWELACTENCDLESLRRLLQPACTAARAGGGQIDWWAVTDHPITEKMLALGFTERPRSLCVLGKIFNPAGKLSGISGSGQRIEVHVDGCDVEIKRDAATRMVFGRSLASHEYQHGLVTVRPLQKTHAVLKALDSAHPVVRWSYFASEYI